MKDIEYLAKKLFRDYSIKHTGLAADWNYLSNTRKLEWVQEVVKKFEICIDALELELPFKVEQMKLVTSYEKGFAEGCLYQSNKLKLRLELFKSELQQQLEVIKTKYANNQN